MSNVTKTLRALRVGFVRRQNWDSAAPFWTLALILGMIQAWTNRFYMGNDGVSYLDMADAYLRGDWHSALNTSWGPLYAWLIGLDFLIFRPPPYWEYPMVQLLNFGIYAAALTSFEYFLRGLMGERRADELALRFIAYGLFLWSSLILTRVWTVNADMLVAASLYAALGLLLRARHRAKSMSAVASVMLGVTLAAGYYSKAVMFPIGLAVLLIASIALQWRRVLIAAFVFALLSAPLIVGVSKAAGHLTFGDTGRVNYAWYVNGVAFRWWQGGPPGSGQPLHPPRIALDSPRVYEFAGAFPQATYPIWYDFAYWYQGLQVKIDLHRTVSVLRNNLKGILKLFALQGGGFFLGWGVCFLLFENKTQLLQNLTASWPIWGASIAALLLYSAIHVEPRYLGAFATVLVLTPFAAIRVPRRWLAAGIAMVGLMWSTRFALSATASGPSYPLWSGTPVNVSWQAAAGLQNLGLQANDRVASACYSNRRNVLWARLANVHIVAETDWDVNFWLLDEADRRSVLAALAASGASMAVSDEAPPDPARAAGWRRAGSTDFYAFSFSPLSQPNRQGAIPKDVNKWSERLILFMRASHRRLMRLPTNDLGISRILRPAGLATD